MTLRQPALRVRSTLAWGANWRAGAERTAAVKAVSEGEREFVAGAVAGGNGSTPCGSCRRCYPNLGKKRLC